MRYEECKRTLIRRAVEVGGFIYGYKKSITALGPKFDCPSMRKNISTLRGRTAVCAEEIKFDAKLRMMDCGLMDIVSS